LSRDGLDRERDGCYTVLIEPVDAFIDEIEAESVLAHGRRGVAGERELDPLRSLDILRKGETLVIADQESPVLVANLDAKAD
jgi:hypothetical protein